MIPEYNFIWSAAQNISIGTNAGEIDDIAIAITRDGGIAIGATRATLFNLFNEVEFHVFDTALSQLSSFTSSAVETIAPDATLSMASDGSSDGFVALIIGPPVNGEFGSLFIDGIGNNGTGYGGQAFAGPRFGDPFIESRVHYSDRYGLTYIYSEGRAIDSNRVSIIPSDNPLPDIGLDNSQINDFIVFRDAAFIATQGFSDAEITNIITNDVYFPDKDDRDGDIQIAGIGISDIVSVWWDDAFGELVAVRLSQDLTEIARDVVLVDDLFAPPFAPAAFRLVQLTSDQRPVDGFSLVWHDPAEGTIRFATYEGDFNDFIPPTLVGPILTLDTGITGDIALDAQATPDGRVVVAWEGQDYSDPFAPTDIIRTAIIDTSSNSTFFTNGGETVHVQSVAEDTLINNGADIVYASEAGAEFETGGNQDFIGGRGNDRVILDLNMLGSGRHHISGGGGSNRLEIAGAGSWVVDLLRGGAYEVNNPSRFVRLDGYDTIIVNTSLPTTLIAGNSGGTFTMTRPGTFVGGEGDDVFDGTGSFTGIQFTHTVSYTNATGGVRVSLELAEQRGGPVAQDTGAGVDTLIAIENLDGSQFADTLRGDGERNRLYGLGGGDFIFGLGGDDVIDGGAGNDYLYGGDGQDQLIGGDGDDLLAGDGGNDLIEGGRGADDIFGGDGVDQLYGGADGDRLFGGAGNDWLYGEAGNDLLSGGAGRDYMSGGLGADIFEFGSIDDLFANSRKRADQILDFSSFEGDQIDLSALGPNPQDFYSGLTFIGRGGFSGAGDEIRYQFEGRDTMIYGDLDGDLVADFAIRLFRTRTELEEGSFIL